MKTSPWATVALTAVSYTLLLRALPGSVTPATLRTNNRKLSAAHSTITTILALYCLRYSSWILPEPRQPGSSSFQSSTKASTDSSNPPRNQPLNDSSNPLIQSRSHLANHITAFETGYIIYDTLALLSSSYLSHDAPRSLLRAPAYLAHDAPIFFAHHLALIASLGWLQNYISSGREKGVKVILAFLLMNASSPLLHARWFVRQRTGRADKRLDVGFAAAFAVSRLGTVAWVLRTYGAFHGLGAWEAYKRLRVQCRTGTAALVGFNAVWWVLLVRKIIHRDLLKRNARGKT